MKDFGVANGNTELGEMKQRLTMNERQQNHLQNGVNETVVRVQLIGEAPIHVEKNDRLRHGHGSKALLGFS